MSSTSGRATDTADVAGRYTTRRRRAIAVVAAVGAAVAVWLVAEPLAEVDLRSPTFEGYPGADIGVRTVILSSAVAALAGWGLLAVLERWTRRPRVIWTVIAVVALVISLGGPMSGTGITAANRWFLALMHLSVGAILIPLMVRSSGDRPGRAES